MRAMTPEELFCRDQLRASRAIVLRDSEAFPEILFALERCGSLLTHRVGTLATYKSAFEKLANRTLFGSDQLPGCRGFHTPFGRLYSLLTNARNEALHLGAVARHLARYGVEMALVLEEALMVDTIQAQDLMVRSPVCAELWQPLSYVRQQMLANSFSYLPIRSPEGQWALLSDLSVAAVLRKAPHNGARQGLLARTVREAIADFDLKIHEARQVRPDSEALECLGKMEGPPLLVTSDDDRELLGILTPFDLL